MPVGYAGQATLRREQRGMSAESQSCEAGRQLLLGHDYVNKPIFRQWLISRHVKASKDMHTTEELREEVFSVQSMLRLHNEDQQT
jgi:hypothetical protein